MKKKGVTRTNYVGRSAIKSNSKRRVEFIKKGFLYVLKKKKIDEYQDLFVFAC